MSESENQVKQKLALVTGASRGIGRAILISLAQQGYEVIGTATSENGAQKITDDLLSQNLSGKGVALNLSNKNSISDLLDTFKDNGQYPDILINNAGITRDNLMMRMSEEEWSSVIETNLSGVFYLTQGILRPMMKKRWGRVINIGSVVGSIGNPGQVNYCAAKAGLLGFSKAMAIEVASRNITVNVIAPGFIQTDMTDVLSDQIKENLLNHIPMKQIGSPNDIAHAVNYLASEGARYMTGQILHINGGMFMGS